MTENFPKWVSDIKPQIQEVQRTPSRINAKKPQPTNQLNKQKKLHLVYIIFKLKKIKDKDKILEEIRGGKSPHHISKKNKDKNYIQLLRNHVRSKSWNHKRQTKIQTKNNKQKMATNIVDINTTISIITLIQKEGGGVGRGTTYIPVADSYWYMAKSIQYCKVIKLQLK